MSLWARARPLLLLLQTLVFSGVHLAAGVEQIATVVAVTASKYDPRSYTAIDEYKGCFTNGCEPELLIDGLLNDEPQSRWSCAESLAGSETECFATFDLGAVMTLTKITIYFHLSDDLTRTTNPFVISVSDFSTFFIDSFEGVNTAGTPIGTGEDFEFRAGSSGRYVRLTGVLAPDQWLSINEMVFFVNDGTPSPTPGFPSDDPSFQPTVSVTSVPTVLITVDTAVTAVPTASPTPSDFTPGPTLFGGEACSNITVSGAGDLSGLYSASVATDGTVVYVLSGASTATIEPSESPAECSVSGESACSLKSWIISSTEPVYLTFDEATHPVLIREVWLRLDCVSETCNSSPADVTIVCGDGTGGDVPAQPTPAPLLEGSSDCGIIEVAGTSGAEADGFYYDDGSSLGDGVAQYIGYDAVGSELTSNGNAVLAKRVDGTCSTSTSTSATADSCSWRQWSIEPESVKYYLTYDDADHPVDIPEGALWYTSDATMLPYDGAVAITCAPATTPALAPSTPVTQSPADGDATPVPAPRTTRAPVAADPTEETGSTSRSAGGDSDRTPVIVGSVVAGFAVLVILGAVAYKMKKRTPPPPPSYDDLVGA